MSYAKQFLSNLQSNGLSGKVESFQVENTYKKNMKNYATYIKEPQKSIEIPEPAKIIKECPKFTVKIPLTLQMPPPSSHSCFSSQEIYGCEMFEIKILVKSIDEVTQKMRYSLNKFNLQNSIDFRGRICDKLKESGVFNDFKIRKLLIDRIEEGIVWKGSQSSSHPVVVIKIFGNLVQNRVVSDEFYQIVKNSWTDISAIDNLSSNLKNKMSSKNVICEDRGIYPNSAFIQAIDIYDSWKDGNDDVSEIINNDAAVSCGENFDAFFIIERQTGFQYQKVNTLIRDLITYFPMDRISTENTKGARWGVMSFGLGNPVKWLNPNEMVSKSDFISQFQPGVENPVNPPSNDNQNLYIGSAVNSWHDIFADYKTGLVSEPGRKIFLVLVTQQAYDVGNEIAQIVDSLQEEVYKKLGKKLMN